MNNNPFSPLPASSVVITAGATSTPLAVPVNANKVRVCVTGATAVAMETTGPAVAATSMRIFPNIPEIFGVRPGGQIEFINTGADSSVAITFGVGS